MTTTPTLLGAAQALKPCPFCGGPANFPDACEPRKPLYWAECKACGVPGADDVTMEGAAAKWNRRAASAAPADALAEPVATIADLQARIDDLEVERDEALRAPWPEWAERMTKTIRKYSGYGGFDDQSEGIDLPAELDELMEHIDAPPATQLQQAVVRALEELKFHPSASHVEPNYRDWFNRTIAAAIRAKGTHD